MTRKHSIEHVMALVQQKFPGYVVLSTDYGGINAPMSLNCPRHGPFSARLGDITRGHGCPACGQEKQRQKRMATTKVKTLEALQRLHPALTFPYFDEEYAGTTSWVTVRCPLHGDVRKQPHKMITSKQGCPQCGAEASTLSRTYTLAEVLDRFKRTHGNRYNYSKVTLSGYMNHVTIICETHGEFRQSPQQHNAGQGCPKCAPIGRKQNQIKPFGAYVAKASNAHSSKYTYIEDSYTGFSGKVEVVCPVHGSFFANGFDHLYGSGCPQCSTRGFKPHLPAWFYIYIIDSVGVSNVGFGITNDINRRDSDHQMTFRGAGVTGLLLHAWEFNSGQQCKELESTVLRKFNSVDTGLSGFRREATSLNNLTELFSFVSNFHTTQTKIPA